MFLREIENENSSKFSLTNQEAISYIKNFLNLYQLTNQDFSKHIEIDLMENKSFNKEEWRKILFSFYPKSLENSFRIYILYEILLIALVPCRILYDIKLDKKVGRIVWAYFFLGLSFYTSYKSIISSLDNITKNRREKGREKEHRFTRDAKILKTNLKKNIEFVNLISSNEHPKLHQSISKNIYFNIFMIIKYHRCFLMEYYESKGFTFLQQINHLIFKGIDIELDSDVLKMFDEEEFKEFRKNIIEKTVKYKIPYSNNAFFHFHEYE